MRALIWLRYEGDADWVQIVRLPDVHLRSCRNALDWPTARFAARMAEPGKFLQTAMLYRDTVKLGGCPDSKWSLHRLKREYDLLSVNAAIENASARPWATPFETSDGPYQFTRLISDRDLVREGKLQRHCIATYREAARDGACVVMKCTGAERATMRFSQGDVHEINGFGNGPVSAECSGAAMVVRREFEEAAQSK